MPNTTESAANSLDQQSYNPKLLRWSAQAWFLTAVLGQWIFVGYVVAHYLPKLMEFGLTGLSQVDTPGMYVAGDCLGNAAIALHVVLAIFIIGGGPLQLLPIIRRRFPVLHRWNGRLYLLAVLITSLAGLHLVWSRGVPGGPLAPWAISLDAILIILFGAIALRYAIKGAVASHRRWALRLFMVVNAVWFFRIGLMLWFLLTGGLGIDPETFTGPFINFIYFGQMFIPLAFLELYFWAQKQSSKSAHVGVAVTLGVATIITGIGIFGATMGMWLPAL